MTSSLPLVLSPTDVAAILGLNRNKVYELLRDGTIRSKRVGRRFLIPSAALLEFLEDTTVAPVTPLRRPWIA